MQTPPKVRFWLVMMVLSLSAQSQAEEGELPLDMSFLEYLGAMIEDDGQLVDVTEVFAQDIQYPETSPQTDAQYDTSAELPAQMRKRLQNFKQLSPQQKQRLRQRFKNLSPEDCTRALQRMQRRAESSRQRRPRN